jgi:hypothetical protein
VSRGPQETRRKSWALEHAAQTGNGESPFGLEAEADTTAGVRYDRLDAHDVTDATGALGVFPSWARIAPNARLDLTVPFLVLGEHASLGASGGLTPFALFVERA